MAIRSNDTLMRTRSRLMYAALAPLLSALLPTAAMAQVTPPSNPSNASAEAPANDIVVTARRRDETLQSVPVTVSAVTEATINARGITGLDGIARTIPQLIIAEASGAFQGGAVSLRGISAGDGNNFGDQAVGFYIDNVLVARSTPRRLSEYDIGQVEVLKGPQALFYGKNSPGGVVVLRSNDPGNHFEAQLRGSYEINARQVRADGFISTPLTDSLGVRVAATGSTMRGWIENIATPSAVYGPSRHWLPHERDFSGRVTLKFDDGGPLTARLKFNYGKLRTSGQISYAQLVDCPAGLPQAGGTDNCKADDKTTRADLGPRFGTGGANTVTGAAITGIPQYGNGVPYANTTQYLGGLDLAYKLNDKLTLSSVTGYYQGNIRALDQFGGADTTLPYAGAGTATPNPAGTGPSIIAAFAFIDIREISEEMRLTSSFDGPFNFMVGGYFQDQKLRQQLASSDNALNPIVIAGPVDVRQKGTSYSFFASASFKPTDTIEISGGARYSNEKKDVRFLRLLPGTLPAAQGGASYLPGDLIPTTRPSRTFHNVSPEATISWRPSSRYTIYGSWKRGFLSGGFNPGAGGVAVALLADRSYDEETVQGFEIGAKGIFLNGLLRANVAAYDYKINKLQVTSGIASTAATFIGNAATARTKGLEGDVTITPMRGLNFHGAAAYSHANYLTFNTAPCYGGQSVAAGCNIGLNPATGAYTIQDLSGKPLVRSPRWGVAVGTDYERRFDNGDKAGFNIDGNYSSKLYTDNLNSPGGIQQGYWLLDAGVHYNHRDRWELALIGKNLTNDYYFLRSNSVTFTGRGTGTNNALRSDTQGTISRGREIVLRGTLNFK